MSAQQDSGVQASELLDVIHQYKEQLAAVAAVIADDPDNTEAQQIHDELQEALEATEAGYADCFLATSAATGATAVTPGPAAAAAETGPVIVTPRPQLRADGRTMHPDNIYSAREPDFGALAAQHPPLAEHVTLSRSGRPTIDFTSWAATKELTAALLKVDFAITWDLPEGQLVPPVPNRANYVHWINDLLQLSSPQGDIVRGLDIGCGANLIYCLLGAAVYGWHMTGVDVTPVALQGAAAIREANPQLQHLLEVRQSQCTVGTLPQQQQQQQDPQQQQPVLGPLCGALSSKHEQFHFCMCNPPFFESMHEASQNPSTACGGTAAEMVCPGGELAFIRAMIADSQKLKGQVHWYSSMCGKKATLKTLRQELHAAGVTALRTTELVQGRTSRWCIAWSYAADPNTANMPLIRKQQQQQQQQQQRGQVPTPVTNGGISSSKGANSSSSSSALQNARKVSFTVTATAADGRKLLQSVAALLTAVGGAQQVRVDEQSWKIRCQLLQSAAAAAAAAAADDGYSQQQQQKEGCNGSEPAAKRVRTAVDQQAIGAAVADNIVSSGSVAVEVALFQQGRNSFSVVAEVLSSSSSCGLLEVFTAVREDLLLMWPVGELKSF